MTAKTSITHSFQKWGRWIAFGYAIFSCLSSGSITLYSLWAPAFQQKLGYSQMQVNAISIAGELGLYLPVPIFGYICDQLGPNRLSILAAAFFGSGYALASFAFSGDFAYQYMVIAFALIGMGTSAMYFSGITTCAKNFTRSRGLALSFPIASCGLSGFWQSQLVSRVFVDASGAVMVNAVFVAYSVYLIFVGLVGGVLLQVFPEEIVSGEVDEEYYDEEEEGGEEGRLIREEPSYGTSISCDSVDSIIDDKRWINNATRSFLLDKTVWLFATGVFLLTGPCEAFMNNMGSLVLSLTPPAITSAHINPATHVSLLAIFSTAARIISGVVSDYLAPPVGHSVHSSRPRCSRMVFLLLTGTLLLVAHLLLASGYIQLHSSQFWIISSSIGAGYGATFTLAPTVVSVVWGTENFGTNWGMVCMTPALGATVYGVIYASVYDEHAGDDGRCFDQGCYAKTFGIMAVGTLVAMAGWVYAWRMWKKRGVVV
ncbi:major facilitator superfamily domain-containing protein [Morchella snyderi]|nr:major facilitator superfamily domain-containing protein [Morchella snyderi]